MLPIFSPACSQGHRGPQRLTIFSPVNFQSFIIVIGDQFTTELKGAEVMRIRRQANDVFALIKNKVLINDGSSFVDYKTTPLLARDSISENRLTSLAVDDEGKLWVGTFENGIENSSAHLGRQMPQISCQGGGRDRPNIGNGQSLVKTDSPSEVRTKDPIK